MPEIALPPGQINLKGPQQPNVVNRWFSTTSSLTFTGLALTLAIAISVPAGGLTLTGLAPVEDSSFPTAGRITWQGLTPTATISSAGTTLTPGVGAVTFQGLTPSLRIGDVYVDIPAGQLVIKGPQRPQVVPQLSAGTLRYTGYACAPQINTPGSAASIPAGSLAFTGQTPIRDVNVPRPIPAGSLVLTGQYVGIQFMQPSSGSLVWQGLAPTVSAQTVLVQLQVGRLQWGQTTLTPSLIYEITIPVPVGSLVLTGHQLNVGTPETLVLQAGSLALTGQTPTLDWSTGLPVGTLRYTGQAATVVQATAAPGIPAGSLVWQGYAPVIIHSNGTVLSSTVRIVRSLSNVGTITRTVSSEVQR
jgi:hypothetical protein